MLLFYFCLSPSLEHIIGTVLDCLIPSDSTFESHSNPSWSEYCLFFFSGFLEPGQTLYWNGSDSLFSLDFFCLLDNLGGNFSVGTWSSSNIERKDLQNFKRRKKRVFKKEKKKGKRFFRLSVIITNVSVLSTCSLLVKKTKIGTFFFSLELVKCVNSVNQVE